MKYIKLYEEIKSQYNKNFFTKKDIEDKFREIYNTDNEKTIRNIIGIFKNNNLIKEVEKNKYFIVTNKIYIYKKSKDEEILSKLIQKEYPELKLIVWNTNAINEFTQHYVTQNYIIIETQKVAIELIVNLLKSEYSKKYTVITENIFNNNRKLYDSTENIIIVKDLHTKSPLKNRDISIEKMMVDLYADNLYIQYQGKELETIYENILNNYDIDFKRLIKYAEYRVDLEKYRLFINELYIPKKYKFKE